MGYLGKQPSAVPLTTADLIDGSVTSDDIADLDAAKLTGTVNNARISLDAAEIPNLDAAKITTGTIGAARLGSGTASSTTILYGDGSYKAEPVTADEITKSTSEPAGDTNPSGGVGTIWLRQTTGVMYCCTDATTDANVWTNIGDGTGAKPYTATVATGGTITTDGNFKVHVFNASGTFQVTTLGDATTVEYLVIAGGGGGGGRYMGGGGGAGGYRTNTGLAVTATSYTVTVGAGGAAGTLGNLGSDGVNSSLSGGSISAINATGGGGGGSSDVAGRTGGSGGGTNQLAAIAAGNAGGYDPVEGYAGGDSASSHYGGSGGGGASEVGGDSGNAGANPTGGHGGDGRASSITGASVTRAGGGGGGAYSSNIQGDGGAGGGADGTNGDPAPTAATANTGGGGGGAERAGSGVGGAGGSGVVIIRYQFQE